MKVIKLRTIANTLLEKHNYDDAFIIYDEIYSRIWSAIGLIQSGISDFTSKFFGGNFKANYRLKKEFISDISQNAFKKWFDLDIDQIHNEFCFIIFNRIKCVTYSSYLSNKISSDNIYLDFLILQNLVIQNNSDDWVNDVLKYVTLNVEDFTLKKIKSNLSDTTIKKQLIENASSLKNTDWNEINVCFLDYLFNIGDNSSNLYTSVRKIVGLHFHRKTHHKKTHTYEKEKTYTYEKFESYERYESYEKFHWFNDDNFDPAKATDFEKAKFYGKVLGLSGKVTKSYIRKKYLELISKYHPDKVFNLGEELKILAELKTKQINAAYEWMKKKYNI